MNSSSVCNWIIFSIIGIFVVFFLASPAYFGVTYSIISKQPVESINCTVKQYYGNYIGGNCDLQWVNRPLNTYYGRYAYCPKDFNENDPNKIYTCYVYNQSNTECITGSKFDAQYYNTNVTGPLFVISCVLFGFFCIVFLICLIVFTICCSCKIYQKNRIYEILGVAANDNNKPNNDIAVVETHNKNEGIEIISDNVDNDNKANMDRDEL